MESKIVKAKCPCGLSTGYLRINNVWHCTKCGRDTPQEILTGDSDAAGKNQ